MECGRRGRGAADGRGSSPARQTESNPGLPGQRNCRGSLGSIGSGRRWAPTAAATSGARRTCPAAAGEAQADRQSPHPASLVALACEVMGRVSDYLFLNMHALADPISPIVAMPSRPAPPPSRHLLSSYGILLILLTMVSMVRHTFHMAQYHFASHFCCPLYFVLFFPAFLAPFSGSICRHL